MNTEKRASYLSTLKFKPNLLSSFQAKYLAQIRLPILFILLIVIVGIFSFVQIPRRLNPQIKIPFVIVTTVLPGAGPEDIEQLVTVPLERELSGVDGLSTLSSVSRDNVSLISMEFVSTKDTKDAVADVQTEVNKVTDLPNDVIKPTVAAVDFENQPFWTFAITSKSDTASLMRFAESLKKNIEQISVVDHVSTSGLEDQTIEVEVDPEKAKDYSLNPAMISGLVKAAAHSFPAGIVNNSLSTFSLSIDRDIQSIEDIRNIRLTTSGTTVRLGDIASVVERSKSGQQNTYISAPAKSPERAVQFFVFKKTNADIENSFKKTEPVVQRELHQYEGKFSLFNIQNTAALISDQFSDLYREFFNTSVLVFILLFVFLGLRQGIISNVTVPLTFLATFAVIQASGLTLNFLTIFSFLLSLGILIDDTIVVVAAMTRYYKTGKFTPYQTGIMVWKDFIVPLWSSAITTVWGFVPLLLATGIIGEFIKSIPLVVTTTMIASTLISVLITIPLMIIFLKPEFPPRVKTLGIILGVILYAGILMLMVPKNAALPVILIVGLMLLYIVYRIKKRLRLETAKIITSNVRLQHLSQWMSHFADHGLINIEGLSNRYRIVIDNILKSDSSRRRTLIAIACFTILAYLLLPMGLIKNEFFPKSDEDIMYASIDLPAGTDTRTVNSEMLAVANTLRSTKQLDFLVAEAGQKFQSDGSRLTEPSSILFTLHLTKHQNRHISSSDIAESVRKVFSRYNKGTFSVVELSGGPPAGADIQIKLSGDDLGVLDGYANTIMSYLKKQPGVINIDKSVKSGTSKIVFVPDKATLGDAGLSVDQIALWLRTYASGFTLDSILFGDKEKDIIFRTNAYDDKPVEKLSAIEIPTPKGISMPLSALGSFTLEANPTIITRENQKRTISVFAGVTTGVNIPEKNAELLKYADSLTLPSGYEWKTGGVNDENQKSVESILRAMGLAFLLILVTMVIEFGSFRQAFIAMLMIPISVAGVFYIFALLRVPLSFAALIGVLALFGIVMRHAIVVMEKINDNRHLGLNLRDAITDAAASRLEPVLLTSLATIAGLVPITIADPFWRGLGGTIIAGLLFTGALKLFLVPVLYYDFYKGEKTINRSRAS